MNPTLDWLKGAEKQIRLTLEQLRPKLLEAQGNIEHKLKDDKTVVTEMDTLVEDRRRVANMIKFAAFGYESVQLASGAIDGRIMYCSKAKPWDLTAPSVILQEAGGCIANIGSKSFNYRSTDIVAANPVIFDELMQLMNGFAAARA